jgi:hypothetical protein
VLGGENCREESIVDEVTGREEKRMLVGDKIVKTKVKEGQKWIIKESKE